MCSQSEQPRLFVYFFFFSFLIAHEQFPGQTNQSTQPSEYQQFSEALWKYFKSQAEHKEE